MEAALGEKQAVQISQLGVDWAQQNGFLRFLHNEHIEERKLIRGITNRLPAHVAGKHVLMLEDTSEVHYHRQAGRIKNPAGLGDAGRSPLGYFIHPSLVVNAEDASVLGLSNIHVWHRDKKRAYDTGSRKKRPIEDKESYKWILGAQRSKCVLNKAEQVTVIQDRDGDIFESFARLPDDHMQLLIRSKTDRRIVDDHDKWLYRKLSRQPVAVVYELEVKSDNKKRKKRKARIEVRFTRVRIKRPATLGEPYPLYIELTAVEALEQAQSVPKGEAPIHWRLLTTHRVEDFTQAVQIVYWYSLRWLIEEFFRVLKTKGFNLESSLLGSGWALRKLGILTMQAATKVMQLRQSTRDVDCPLPVDIIFDEQEQKCLQDLSRTLEGKTQKLKNPYPAHLLSWASWIIARLGGWKGYQSQRPAGVITLTRGLERFEAIFVGWKLANQMQEEDQESSDPEEI